MHFDYSSPLRLSPSTAGVTVEEHANLRVRPGPSFHDDPDGAGLLSSLGEAPVPHSPATHGVMRNEEQLARRLAAEGFAIIRPHNMSSRQQIEAFSAADVIVGASGSAMFNVVFSRPGTRLIDIESEPHWIFAHTNLFGSCGLGYGILEAKAIDQDWGTAHKPFSVNVDALMARVTSST